MGTKKPPLEYRGHLISRQRTYGPLGLLKWTDDEGFIITKVGANILPGAVFRTEEEARKTVDLLEKSWFRLQEFLDLKRRA